MTPAVSVGDVDPRALLAAGPDGYTAARDAEVKRRRGDGDKAGAAALKALGRPGLALWAVLAAADGAGAALATAAVDATAALAAAQRAAARDGDAGAVAVAAAERRRAVDAVRDRAVAELAAHVDQRRAEGQRDDIRSLVDRATRHPDLLAAWLDGTLRVVPEDTGFEAFADLEVAPRPDRPPRPERRLRLVPTPSRDDAPDDSASDGDAERARAEATAAAARAKAKAEVAQAEQDVERAAHAAAEAERAWRAADAERERAAHRLEAARRALGE